MSRIGDIGQTVVTVSLLGAMLMAGGVGGGAAAAAVTQKVITGLVGITTSNWPLFVAEQEGFFRQAGIEVEEILTGGPVESAAELGTGSVNISSNGTDTWVRTVASRLSVKIIAPGFITDPYTLVTKPGITSWSELKGKTLILGTRTDVTAISFAAMANAHGLTLSDFTIVTAGNTSARYAALNSSQVDAAMLTQPFDLLAVSRGLNQLATSRQYVPHWVFACYAVNTNWAASHRSAVVGFLKGLIRGVQYAYANPRQAVQIMATRSRIADDVVQKAYDLDFNQWHAFSKTEQLDPTDLEAVVTAVMQQGTVKRAPTVAKLFDPSYVEEALGR